MKHFRWTTIWIVVLSVTCVFAVTGCGSQEPIIETAAADINLTATDLGFDWTAMSEQGLDEMPAANQPHIRDVNMRMFSSESLTGMATSFVFTTDSVSSAQQEMKSESVENLGADITAQVEGLTLEPLTPPTVGDEAKMVGGNIPELDMNVYVLAFRKVNVVVLLSVMGASDRVTEAQVVDYAHKVEARIQ